MQQITNISMGPESDNYQFETEFMNQHFTVRRFGTDGDLEKAKDLLLKWNKKADVICIGSFQFAYTLGSKPVTDKKTQDLFQLASQLQIPVTTGDTLRRVSHEWCIRHIQFQLGDSYFTNANVLFLSGMVSSSIINVMKEYTDNLSFADPIFNPNFKGGGIPKILNTVKGLKTYFNNIHRPLQWIPGIRLASRIKQVKTVNNYLLRKAVKKASVIVVPYYGFFSYLENIAEEELAGKIVITTTAYDDRVDLLKKKGADVIIDTTPKILERVVGISVLEAIMIAAQNIPKSDKMQDELLEIISEQRINPRIIYPSNDPKRVNRFAYIVHPISRDYLKKLKPVEFLSEISQASMVPIEKLMAYSPPFVYSKVSGIKSSTGVEAEGWLIGLGITHEQMQAHDPEFTTSRILKAAEKAKSLGAQVMGIGLLPKQMQNTNIDIGKYAVLPVTTGNSYTASTALWASAEAVRQMGLIKLKNDNVLKAKTMVIGATGSIGTICSHLLATAFEEIYLVSRNMAKLLTIQENIQQERPGAKVFVSTRADTHIGKMDVIVATSSNAKQVLDIMKVKPGCVITDITRPMIFSEKDIVKRQDVLVISGGEILLPGENIEMKDIGLPPHEAYAGMAETIILALEGKFKDFTGNSETHWEKVKNIYKLGLKHGMKLSAISGVNGVLSKEDIARVKNFALKQLKLNENY
ncbi:MAG: dehydrogenase [Thermodesulfobacteriota bacterium]|nr:dehydrogenase [Thermodesulfobacteriota bacterium]